MAYIPGVNLFSTTGAVQVGTLLCASNASPIKVGDLLFMDANGLVDKIADGTAYTTANTVRGIVGIAVSAAAASTSQGVQVALIDGNTRLILPNIAAAQTQATVFGVAAANSFPVTKLTAVTNGVGIGQLGVDLASAGATGIVKPVASSMDATGFTGTMPIGSDGLSGGVISPTSGVAAAALAVYSVLEAVRYVKG